MESPVPSAPVSAPAEGVGLSEAPSNVLGVRNKENTAEKLRTKPWPARPMHNRDIAPAIGISITSRAADQLYSNLSPPTAGSEAQPPASEAQPAVRMPRRWLQSRACSGGRQRPGTRRTRSASRSRRTTSRSAGGGDPSDSDGPGEARQHDLLEVDAQLGRRVVV
jgi:hypothetical protein